MAWAKRFAYVGYVFARNAPVANERAFLVFVLTWIDPESADHLGEYRNFLDVLTTAFFAHLDIGIT